MNPRSQIEFPVSSSSLFLFFPIYCQESGVSSNNSEHDGNGENGVHVTRSDSGESFKRDIRELHELLSKLNHMAEEFVPPSLTKPVVNGFNGGFFAIKNGFGIARNFPINEDGGFRRKKWFGQQRKRKMNPRTVWLNVKRSFEELSLDLKGKKKKKSGRVVYIIREFYTNHILCMALSNITIMNFHQGPKSPPAMVSGRR